MTWPSCAIRRATTGSASAQRPWRNNVERTPAASSASRIAAVAHGAVGRSANSTSNVSATRGASLTSRRR